MFATEIGLYGRLSVCSSSLLLAKINLETDWRTIVGHRKWYFD